MQRLQLDSQLIQLNNEYIKLDKRFAFLEEEIESLEDEKDSLESEMSSLEGQIKRIKTQLLDLKIQDINVFTDDKFTNDFIVASYLAMKDDERRGQFQYINITDIELMATDGYKGIIIKCDCIPDDVKNSKIKWDVRSNFAENINHELGEFPDLKSIIEGARSTHKKAPTSLTAKEFYETFEALEPEDHGVTIIKLKIADIKIAFNKEFLDTALMCMGEESFDVYVGGHLNPVLLESGSRSIVVLPIRVVDWE